MNRAEFRFYAHLNGFLEPRRRCGEFRHEFTGNPSVKDRIEALGVPHTEVAHILVNGEFCEFTRQLMDSDRVAVYPRFESLEPAAALRLRPDYPGRPRFVMDVHLGRLARFVRMLGFDAVFRNDAPDEELARISAEEDRILLTRDRALLKRSSVIWGCFVRSGLLEEQLRQIMRRYSLASIAEPFTRCPRCNAELVEAESREVRDRVPERVLSRQDAFRLCPRCGRIYWSGTHIDRVRSFFAGIDETLRL